MRWATRSIYTCIRWAKRPIHMHWVTFWSYFRDRSPLEPYSHGEVWIKFRTWVRYLQLDRSYTGIILDLGCGPGWLCIWLAGQFPGSTVVGMDAQQGAIQQALKNRDQAGVKNVHFLVGSVVNLPFADGSCPKAISTQVYEHLPPPHDHLMLEECHRVVQEGGDFVLNTPGPLFLEHRSYPVYKLASWLRPRMKESNETLRRYWDQGTYDAWGIHEHVRSGFYPWEVFDRAPWGLAPVQYKYIMKHLGALWFQFTSINRIFRGILLPFSYLAFWIDDHLPGTGFDLTIRFQKLGSVPAHVVRE